MHNKILRQNLPLDGNSGNENSSVVNLVNIHVRPSLLINMCKDLIEESRNVTFDWHIARVVRWLKLDNGRFLDSILVYASLDLRIAIERYLLEFLLLLNDLHFSAEDREKCRSINGLFALMKDTDPEYRLTAEFTKIIASVTPEIPEITIIETGYLRRKWEELSEYCHKQLEPNESFSSTDKKFQQKGFRLIQEIVDKFREWNRQSVFGLALPQHMDPDTKNIYDKFVKKEIDADQAQRMLKIIDPVLRARYRNKYQ